MRRSESSTSDPLAELVDAVLRSPRVLDAIAERVSVKLAAKGGDAHTTAQPPPGMSRRRFNELAPSMPGARKVGRAWTISPRDFDAWCSTRRARAPVARETLAASPCNDVSGEALPWSPERTLDDLDAPASR
jgi:hypothetical protein